MIGKYVERFLAGGSPTGKYQMTKRSTVDQAYLIKTGFID
jgi:hypothetical protein